MKTTPQTTAPPTSEGAVSFSESDIQTTLRDAAQKYKDNNVAGAVNTLTDCFGSGDPRVKNALSMYKREGAPKMVKLARDSYRTGRYKSAVDLLTEAGNFGSRDAVRLLPQYKARLGVAHKEEAHERRVKLKTDKEDARQYEGDSPVKIAIGGVYLHRSTELHVAKGNGTFVEVFISAMNTGDDIAHVNPNDFTLADQEGDTVPHDADTYSLSNYFNAVDLRPNQKTSGWLLFYLKRDTRYTLSYQGFAGAAQKAVIP